jgi:hypothetical protein
MLQAKAEKEGKTPSLTSKQEATGKVKDKYEAAVMVSPHYCLLVVSFSHPSLILKPLCLFQCGMQSALSSMAHFRT